MVSGLIVGGADRGVVSMYDAKKLIKGENALVFSQVRIKSRFAKRFIKKKPLIHYF
jgi:hypothetical protein